MGTVCRAYAPQGLQSNYQEGRKAGLDKTRTQQMTFKFECPHCRQSISATAELITTTAACPTCGKDFIVPSPPVHSFVPSPSAHAARVPKTQPVRLSPFAKGTLIVVGYTALMVICLWWSMTWKGSDSSKPQASQNTRTDPTIDALEDAFNRGQYGGREAGRAGFSVPTRYELHSIALKFANQSSFGNKEAWAGSFERGFAIGYKEVTNKAF